TLLWSTYLGGQGADAIMGLKIDVGGNVVVTGNTNSTDFPTTAGAYRTSPYDPTGTTSDAFVTKLSGTNSAMIWSTFLGGAGNDFATAIAADAGFFYITGYTSTT